MVKQILTGKARVGVDDMNKFGWLILLLIGVAAIGIWYVATDKQGQKPAADIGVTVGKQAPQFSLPALNGNGVIIAQAGKTTVLNFWTTWCPSCREELPEMQKFVITHRSDVNFWAIDIEEPAEKVNAFVLNNNYSIPVLLDGDGAIAATFQINAIPTTLVLDGKGIIRFRKTGGVTQGELEDVLKGL